MDLKIVELTDTMVSAALQTKGYTLKGVYRNEKGDVVFLFMIPIDRDVLQEYYTQKLEVVPQLFVTNLKELRNLVSRKDL